MVGRLKVISILASAFFAVAATAQAPAGAPAGSTGVCKDGSYWSGASKRGACSGHKGVQSWYGAGAAEATTPAAADTGAAAASKPAGAHASTPATAPAVAAGSAATADVAKETGAPAKTVTPGGGPGLVWVNSKSNVYHCQSDRWYGKTAAGAYMSEADAKAKGARPDHGKACK